MIMINIDYYNSKKKKKKKKIMGWEKEGGFFDDEETNGAAGGPIIFGSGGLGGGGGGRGSVWPSRSYSCGFCNREFRSAQALGGHMNVHRRDRARLIIMKHHHHHQDDHDIQQTELTASTTHHQHHHQQQQQQLINVITSGGGGGNCQDDDDINGCRKRVKLSRHIDNVIIPLPPTIVFPFFVHEPAAPCSNSKSSSSISSCDQSRVTATQAHDHLDLELRLATP